MVRLTSARPSGARPDVPAKMTSSILPPRRLLAPCSPMTQPRASTAWDLPEPLGPTTAVTPGSKSNVVADANDLKPRTVRLLRCKVFQISIGGGSGCFPPNLAASGPGTPDLRPWRPSGAPWQWSPAAVARPRLADRAGVGGAVHELFAPHDAADPRGRTAPALLPLPAVGVEGPFKVARGTVDVDVQGIEAGAPGGQGIGHHFAGSSEDALGFAPPERVGGPGIVTLRPPEGLVRVDVADPGDEALIQQRALEPGLPLPEAAVKRVKGKMRVQGVARNVRGFLGDDRHGILRAPARTAVVRGDECGDEQTAEDPLVHETQLLRHGSVRAEAQPDLQVLLVRDGTVLHQELSAHPKVGHERDGGEPGIAAIVSGAHCAVLLQRHPEELAAADDVEDFGPFKVPGKILGAQGVAAYGSRVHHVDR